MRGRFDGYSDVFEHLVVTTKVRLASWQPYGNTDGDGSMLSNHIQEDVPKDEMFLTRLFHQLSGCQVLFRQWWADGWFSIVVLVEKECSLISMFNHSRGLQWFSVYQRQASYAMAIQIIAVWSTAGCSETLLSDQKRWPGNSTLPGFTRLICLVSSQTYIALTLHLNRSYCSSWSFIWCSHKLSAHAVD